MFVTTCKVVENLLNHLSSKFNDDFIIPLCFVLFLTISLQVDEMPMNVADLI